MYIHINYLISFLLSLLLFEGDREDKYMFTLLISFSS